MSADCVDSTSGNSPDSGSTDKISFRPYAPLKKRAIPDEWKDPTPPVPLDLSSKKSPLSLATPNPLGVGLLSPSTFGSLPHGFAGPEQWYALSQWYAQLCAAQEAYYTSLALSSGLAAASASTTSPNIHHNNASTKHQLQHTTSTPNALKRSTDNYSCSISTVTSPKRAKTLDKSSSESHKNDSVSSKSTSSIGETDFLCSCGKNFMNLLEFTVHLKEFGHSSVTCQRDKDIAKLVRGQDMWINSEIEQTREILRCIRCKRSFKSLPDLTMHMIETKHFTDIVYSDQQQQQQQPQRCHPSDPTGTPYFQQSTKKLRVTDDSSRRSSTSTTKTEVKEADSSENVLLKIQDLVESSVGKRPAVFQDVLHTFEGDKNDNDDDISSASSSPEVQSYLSPDHISPSPENPLSSLQKLVETTEVTSSSTTAGCSTATTSNVTLGKTTTNSNAVSQTIKLDVDELKSPTVVATSTSTEASSPPTVIMFNPTYVYRPPLYPLCSSLPLFGAGMGSIEDNSNSPKATTSVDITNDSTLNTSGNFPGFPKKAKCNFCSKPFANKGQVRLHISKGKCPSLLRRAGPPYLAYLRPDDRFLQMRALDKLMKESAAS